MDSMILEWHEPCHRLPAELGYMSPLYDGVRVQKPRGEALTCLTDQGKLWESDGGARDAGFVLASVRHFSWSHAALSV
jgi:hypothetical protein